MFYLRRGSKNSSDTPSVAAFAAAEPAAEKLSSITVVVPLNTLDMPDMVEEIPLAIASLLSPDMAFNI